ncbi:MAG: radical SAM protein, partial [Treponema sp.]|nr:radical SAM protein [Treponema sp.]
MIYLVQPPLVQLNAPYPAPYYLKTFLEGRGQKTLIADHSIGLFERIFCKGGLKKIFADAEKAYRRRRDRGQSDGTPYSGKQIRYTERFLSEAERWLSSIDRLTAFLRGRDREFGHLLTLANGTLPGGPRFDACLGTLAGQPPPEAAPLLAGRLLADLADFITHTLDPAFALVRYAEALNVSVRDFRAARKSPGGYILRTFYRPLLDDGWEDLDRLLASGHGAGEQEDPLILGLTIPFSGCLVGALACAESAKGRYGDRVITVAGGGYVNTELRFLEAREFFDYFDYLSFDRGYGSWEAILEHLRAGKAAPGDRSDTAPDAGEERVLYKTLYRSPATGRILRARDIADREAGSREEDSRFRDIDRESVRSVFPDYTGVDFSRYLYPVDETNPMHRLWSDGHWLKAYLAHGCYWHACAFCDVQLDYIRGFEPVDTEALFYHLIDQAEKTGVRGVHLVDEAAPVPSLIRLAELNREAGLPLVFWGNIRFGGDITPGLAALLAAGGLLGISAGIEVASERGLKRLGKGIDIADVVRSCAAFKEQGLLTHAYLIYGYWDEEDQEIIDSAEIMRQFFAEGLLDSAFWHKFILTRHSRIYAEWERGLHRGLIVTGDPPSEPGDTSLGENGPPRRGAAAGRKGPGRPAPLFAFNDIGFEGEALFDRFTEPLDRLLASWMAGDTGTPVTEAFPFKVPAPSVAPHLVAALLDAYARNRDMSRKTPPEKAGPEPRGPEKSRVLFLGSRPMITATARGPALFWRWRLEDHRLRILAAAGCGE